MYYQYSNSEPALIKRCLALTGMLFMLCFSSTAFAQKKISVDEAEKIILGLKQIYNTADSGLSFNVRYTYANETKPAIFIDSLNGKFELLKNSCHYTLDNTETIKNDTYSIMLFKDDKLMYITKSSSSFQIDPVQALDSVMKNMNEVNYSLQSKGKQQTLVIDFPKDASYKQVSLVFDNQKHLLSKIIYLVKTTMLMDPAVANDAASVRKNKYDEYARVETSFTNYRTGIANRDWLNDKKYFTRDGKTFTVSEEYKNYKIFIANPNL